MDKLLSFKFLKAHRAIAKYMNVVCESGEHKITITQIFALWAVKSYKGYSLADIAAKLCMERTTLYRTVDRMRDLIDCNKSLGKRTRIFPRLTKQGEIVLSALTEKVEERDFELAAQITADLEPLVMFLDTVDEEIGYAALQEVKSYKDGLVRSCRDDRR